MIWTTVFSTIKAKLSLWLGSAVIVLIAITKFLAGRNRKLKAENKVVKARNKHAKKVMKADIEIDEQADDHLADIAHDVEEAKKELTKDEW